MVYHKAQVTSNVRHAVFTERSSAARVPHMRQRPYRMKPQWPKTRERSVRLLFRRWSLYVQALRLATSTRSLGQPLEAPSRAGSIYLGGTSQNAVAQSSAATANAGHKTLATSGAVGYAVTLRLHSEVVG